MFALNSFLILLHYIQFKPLAQRNENFTGNLGRQDAPVVAYYNGPADTPRKFVSFFGRPNLAQTVSVLRGHSPDFLAVGVLLHLLPVIGRDRCRFRSEILPMVAP